MKKLSNLILIALVSVFTFSSCNNDDYDFEAINQANIKADKTLDSLFTVEKIKIENYVSQYFENPIEDTVTVSFQYIEKTIKRGLWYEILSEPTDPSFEYTGGLVNSYYGTYYSINMPKVKLKYTAKLLDGTVVDSDLTGTDYNLSVSSSKFNNAWNIAFIPYSMMYQGEKQVLNGLTANGLKKGSKIRVITPSYWAFYSNSTDKIPAYSPLVYEFEVLNINY